MLQRKRKEHKKLIPELYSNLSKNFHQLSSYVFCGSCHSCDLTLISYTHNYSFFAYILILQFSFNLRAFYLLNKIVILVLFIASLIFEIYRVCCSFTIACPSLNKD